MITTSTGETYEDEFNHAMDNSHDKAEQVAGAYEDAEKKTPEIWSPHIAPFLQSPRLTPIAPIKPKDKKTESEGVQVAMDRPQRFTDTSSDSSDDRSIDFTVNGPGRAQYPEFSMQPIPVDTTNIGPPSKNIEDRRGFTKEEEAFWPSNRRTALVKDQHDDRLIQGLDELGAKAKLRDYGRQLWNNRDITMGK